MGPDEYHEKSIFTLEGEGGVKDNTYTNIMVCWAFKKAFEIINILGNQHINPIRNKLDLKNEEL